MRQRSGHDESGDQGGHRTSTVERGAFSHARCTCGWLGPARRARETSQADARAHSTSQDVQDVPDGGGSGDGAADVVAEGDADAEADAEAGAAGGRAEGVRRSPL
ncbi:hypothetical protein [Streptomyces winkii]|uniref:hypothetical protein n=1 Tax=Streptomyces winkii TaxID=3051178 RepID=UPI0028D62DC8|nr:hypothetical protein [Streptomyces sp. DSM 40971]